MEKKEENEEESAQKEMILSQSDAAPSSPSLEVSK